MDQTTQLAEVEYLIKKVETISLPEELKELIEVMLKRIRRMARQGQESGEYEPIAKFIDWCLRIPWNKYTQDNLDLDNAKQIMDRNHYGGEEIKQTILEYLAILKKKQEMQNVRYEAPVICFVGTQGTGKTTMAKSVAEALGRPFFRISLGALSTSSELRGIPKGAPDAEPGQIIKALAHTGSLSPVILLDEIDKVSGEESTLQDFMAILLEVLDPQQNTSFRDLYIDYPIDLSRVFFICTANTLKTITRALLDRLEIIEFRDYSPEEKAIIASQYLIPKVLSYAGLTQQELQFSQDVWPIIIEKLGADPGIRRLESNLERLARKVTKQIVTGEAQNISLTPQNIGNYIQSDITSIESLKEKDYTKQIDPNLSQTQPQQEVQSVNVQLSQKNNGVENTDKPTPPNPLQQQPVNTQQQESAPQIEPNTQSPPLTQDQMEETPPPNPTVTATTNPI